MRKDKEKALQLRRQYKSYKQISQELDIPLGTLAGWLKNEPWSQDIRDKLGREASLAFPAKLRGIVAANKKRWADLRSSYQQEAIASFPELKDDPLFLAGLMLYWGEGDKSIKNVQVKLANGDPEMIRIFHRFLTETLRIPKEKISARLLLYPDLVDSVQKNFWSRSTGIPAERFRKSAYLKGRHSQKRLSYGVCSICISSRAFKERILKWLELYQNYFRSQSLTDLKNNPE